MHTLERWVTAAESLHLERPALALPVAAWLDRAAREGALDATAPGSNAALRERVEMYEAALALVRAVATVEADRARALGSPDAEDEPASPRALVEGLLIRATVLDATGRLGAAAACIAEAQTRAASVGCRALALAVLVARGRILVMQGDEAQASLVLLEGAALARELDARRQEAKLLGNLGFLHGEHEGRSYEAYTRRALTIAREIDDARLIAHSLCNLGGALAQQGRYEEARACCEEGLPLAEGLGMADCVALFRAGLGGVCAGTGALERGVAFYQRSIEHFASTGDVFQVARQKQLVGRHLVAAGRHHEARAFLEESLALCDGALHRNVAWQAHDQLAKVCEAEGDHREALRQLRASWSIRETQLEARATERIRLLELHLEAERASRAAAIERERNAELEASLAQQRRLQAEIEALARTDALTGLFNRRHVGDVVAREMSFMRRKWRPLSIAMLDLDAFKSVNDRFGHEVGDQVLLEVGRRLAAGLRDHDLVARWGGEEFCIVLIDTELEPAKLVVDRLLERIRSVPVETRVGPLKITASVGVTSAVPEDHAIEDVLRRADEALYAAKSGGRDRSVSSHPPGPRRPQPAR
jgi:diguanylate cyclase (GGDEF)-like protein